jgi:hypothetical protein
MRIQGRCEVPYFRRGFAALVSVIFGCFSLWASVQVSDIDPGPSLVAEGIPKIPGSLAASIRPYTTAYGLPIAAWNPSKHEVWLKDLANKTTVISGVETPGDGRQTIGIIPTGGVYDLYFDPQRKRLVYNKDTDGNEAFQMYLYDLESHKTNILTDGKSRNTEPVWSNKGDRIIYSSSPIGSNGVSLFVMNPSEPASNRLIAQSAGTYFKAFDWSPNDGDAVFCDFASNTSSTLWLIDISSGRKQKLSPGDVDYYDSPQFSKDGKGIYVITDHTLLPITNLRYDASGTLISLQSNSSMFQMTSIGMSKSSSYQKTVNGWHSYRMRKEYLVFIC